MPDFRPVPVLHYIYDPLCGWCYGVAPLVAAARQVMTVRGHAGGMLTGNNRRPITPEFRAYVEHHDAQIARLSGQPFGEAYRHDLLQDTSVVLDSEPPIAAVLAAETLAGRGLDLLARLQTAHYVEGRRIAEEMVLLQLATEIGLDPLAFSNALGKSRGEVTHQHIHESRALLARFGGHGFPTFALEHNSRIQTIGFDEHLGRPREWQEWLHAQV